MISQLCRIHFQTSGIVARFPYISIPTRYTLEASQTRPAIAIAFNKIESPICQNGGVSANILTGIVIGAKNGAIETQKDSGEPGSRITAKLK